MTAVPGGRVVLGLGNPLRGDDGVGLAVAEALRQRLEREPIDGVAVATSERGGLDVLRAIAGTGAAVLVDCLELEDAEPGRARWIDAEDIAPSSRLAGPHDIDLWGVLRLGRLLGVPMPSTVRVLGIEARPSVALDDSLSPAVAASVERVAALLHDELRRDAISGCTSSRST